MLKSLSIENYALIDRLHIDFNKGFSVITGETGAGKSIILGALSLILGERADINSVKQGETRCVIEGVFDIAKYKLQPLFEKHDWIYEDESILRREIWANGRSRAFLNDSPAYLSDLKELGEALIDIHSQHQTLLLNDKLFQLKILDAVAGSETELCDFQESFKKYKSLHLELQKLKLAIKKDKEQEEYLRFQYDSLTKANLRDEDEQHSLEEESQLLTHSREIKSALYSAVAQLSEDEVNVESLLKSVIDSFYRIQKVYPGIERQLSRVESAYIDIKDIGEEISQGFEKLDFDPERLQIVEDRLSLIYNLQHKYGVNSVEELINLRDNLEKQLSDIESSDDRLSVLSAEVENANCEMLEKAELLSKKRKNAVAILEEKLVKMLRFLMIPDAQFRCEINRKTEPDNFGIDEVRYLFTANKNGQLRPVSEVASGGELSRLMLSIKAIIADVTALPSLIFDEIDSGTSGEVADRIGEVMGQIGKSMQVISITHLPQIASKGDVHYLVYKEESAGIVTTKIKLLNRQERIREVARMLSGSEITPEAIENAKVMIAG